MAEVFFNQMAAGNGEAISAGTAPQENPHPEVVATMNEVGVDVSSHKGRLLSDALVRSADRVITMGCAVDDHACPSIIHTNVEDWGLPDPKGQAPERVRKIRDEVAMRVESLVKSLGTERA